MVSTKLRYLVCLILLHTWTWESLAEDFQTPVFEISGQQNVLEFLQQALNKLRPGSSLSPSAEILFDVQLQGNGHIVNPTNPIRYDDVKVNKGKGYNKKTGKFTAPRKGLYFFSYSSLPARGATTNVQLLRNDVRVGMIHSVLPEGSSQLSVSNEILRFKQNESVWVQLITGSLWSDTRSLKFQDFLLG